MLLKIGLGLVVVADVEGAEVAVRAGGGFHLADDLREGCVDIGPEGCALSHQTVEHVVVRPITVLDGVGIDGAVGVVPADDGGAPPMLTVSPILQHEVAA